MGQLNKRIIIIGGGPTGIGAAYRLQQKKYTNWVMYEKNNYLGGHSSTHIDKKGFLWDEGGHVLFSHFKEYDNFVAKVLQNNFFRHQRESWIKMPENRWVPYPFQNHIRYLNKEDQLRCIIGLVEANKKSNRLNNFQDWIYSTFGEGIGNIFMNPYNFKVWATPLSKMQFNWIAERVSVIDISKVLFNVINKADEFTWGPNNTFIFPKRGGTGEIYTRAGKMFAKNILLNKELIKIDFRNKKVFFKDGSSDSYDYLITAMPIPRLVAIMDFSKKIKHGVKGLEYNNILVVGIGLKKRIKTTKCWVYFPSLDVPFYRLTYFHNYSRYNVPQGDVNRYSSLMCEISYSKYKHVNKKEIIKDTIKSLITNGVINKKDRSAIISKVLYDISYGYPIPTKKRDSILRKIQPLLMKQGIYSRGRYGAWKYEISNMDHCFMQGYEAVENILYHKKEKVWSL